MSDIKELQFIIKTKEKDQMMVEEIIRSSGEDEELKMENEALRE